MASYSSVVLLVVLQVLAGSLNKVTVSAQCEGSAQCLKDIAALKAKVDSDKLALIKAEDLLSAKIASCSFSCPAGFTKVPGVSKCIKLLEGDSTWDAAQMRCADIQSHLLFLDSQAEADFVKAQIKAKSDAGKAPGRGYWCGARRITDSCASDFVWKTATTGGTQKPLTFTDYAAPNSCGAGFPTEFCMEMNINSAYKWNDVPCSIGNWPICQTP